MTLPELDCLAPPDETALPIFGCREATLSEALEALTPEQARFAVAAGFAGKPGQVQVLPGPEGLAGALFGLGEPGDPYPFGALAALPAATWRLAQGFADPPAALLGFCLGAYRFTRLKSGGCDSPRPRLAIPQSGCTAAIEAARTTWLVRDLINLPANLLGPAELAAAATDVLGAAAADVRCRTITGEALSRDYPAIASVGAGAARPPAVFAADWSGPGAGEGALRVAICGKGVCFDTGGLDLKPAGNMLRMKKDMAGAAIALGLARMMVCAALPTHLHVRLGCVENSISARAMRPLDVIRTRQGLRVEIGNTDAEGRLVLADLLAESSELSPDLVIDFATLTGAARVALGPDLPAFFCNDDDLASIFAKSAMHVHDPVWRLPLWKCYNSYLDSRVADLNNVSATAHAGAVMAALFLERFVGGGAKWLHCDVFAWNESSRPGRPEGGEAQAMRAAFALLVTLCGASPMSTFKRLA